MKPMTILTEIQQAYEARRTLQARLSEQDRYIGHLVRQARTEGNTWAVIANHAGTSDVAVLNASRRPHTP